jgi:murein DD-endopeptidase MepM/ murein hydrolase activator NlpD
MVSIAAQQISAAPAAAQVTVAPGSMVRWPGEGIDQCSLAERSWQAMDDACWYPIDLLTAEGDLLVARTRAGARESRTIRIGAYPYEVQHITLKDDSQVHLSAEDLERVRRENRQIAALWKRETSRRFDLPLGAPLETLPAGGRFGSRRFFNNEPRSPHTGADFAAREGDRVLAVAAGTVVLTGDFFFPGKSVFVDHGDGLISMYFHLSGIAVDSGEEVERGEVLGLVGQTGRTTGPHLHLGIRWHGARVDPELLLAAPAGLPALSP